MTLGDLKSAFMQSDKDLSGRPQGQLYASLPHGGIPLAEGTWVEEGSLVQLNAAVYEVILRPLYLLLGESGPQGHILIEVDDFTTHGNAVHVENMAKLQKIFKFAKWKSIYNSEGDDAGRTVIQDQSYGFHVHQAKFVQERLSPIVIPRGRRSDKKSEPLMVKRGSCVQCGARSIGSNERVRHWPHLAWDDSITVLCKICVTPMWQLSD